jgi:hypothetical protein
MKRWNMLCIFSLLSVLVVCTPVAAGQWGEFIYEDNGKTVTITGYGCPEGDAVIPDTIYDKPVVRIGYEAFYGCTGLTGVTIPHSITMIDDRAFYGCTGLTVITIPGSVKRIGRQAFYGCTGLRKSPARPPGSLAIVNRFE